MNTANLAYINIGFFVGSVYFCLAIYALVLSFMVGWKKRPFVTDQKLLGTFFLCILSVLAYFLFFQSQWIGIVIVYLLFIVDLFLLWIVVPSEFRIICCQASVTPLIVKVLLRVNMPFEQKNNRFILLSHNQSLSIRKTFFQTYRIILEPGKERSLLRNVQNEMKTYIRLESPEIYKRGVQYLLGIGIAFLLFSGTLFYFFFHHYSFLLSM
ncbi:MAG: hypothetical protein PHI40_04260 [Caldisericia bacterium]|nr:hypothetical protein [Caldisericia bacterium]MDD4614609.1 hypothetical protein [Caldisericia bacterium]